MTTAYKSMVNDYNLQNAWSMTTTYKTWSMTTTYKKHFQCSLVDKSLNDINH